MVTIKIITAMGSDQPSKNELEPACLGRADCYVPDRRSQAQALGELDHAISADAVTICDLTGTGVQDTAIATLASKRGASASIGTDFVS